MFIETKYSDIKKQLYRIVSRNSHTGLAFANNQYGNSYVILIGNDPMHEKQMQVICLTFNDDSEKFYKDEYNNLYIEISTYDPCVISSFNRKIKIEAVDFTDSIQTSSLTEIKIQKVSIYNK